MATAGKLDQSLDDILKGRRQQARRTRHPRKAAGKATAAAAPVGGVKKSVKAAKAAPKAATPTGPSAGTGDSKIIVSNLPFDVNEAQIKDYFTKTIGPVKKALLTYGPNGVSRGICTIIFSKPGAAAEAAKSLNGVKVDNKPMKIEVVVDAKHAPVPAPPKPLSERIAQPKAQPKPATATKATAGKGAGKGKKGPRRGRNAGRGKPKTAEELDAEMQDYFESSGNNGQADATMASAAPATNGGDTGMEDEIM